MLAARGGVLVKVFSSVVVLLAAMVFFVSGAEPAVGPAAVAGKGKGGSGAPKWKLVFSDDFTTPDLSKWHLYSGQPGGDPGGWWDPSHVVVSGGLAHLQTYQDPAFGNRWVSAGMTNSRVLKQTYGKYVVRFRATAGYGVSNVLLLWPVADHWPPEIDFAEDGGTSETGRPSMTATLHYGADNRQIQRTLSRDFTQWHELGVEWAPGKLVYTLDGTQWGLVKSVNVPKEPMEMAMQTQAGTCGDVWTPCPNATTPPLVELQVDWVKAYAYKN